MSCHNGTTATGKGPTHITTTTVCEACHRPTVWTPVTRVDHLQVLGTCVSCHNGTTATGKSATHIASSNYLRRLPYHDRLDAGDVRSHRHYRQLRELP